MPKIKWDITPEDDRLIEQIVDRVMKMWSDEFNRLDITMDITAAHLNGCPLKLEKLLKFDEFNFNHDIFGIRNCIDRKTGKLTRNFLPRCSR